MCIFVLFIYSFYLFILLVLFTVGTLTQDVPKALMNKIYVFFSNPTGDRYFRGEL